RREGEKLDSALDALAPCEVEQVRVEFDLSAAGVSEVLDRKTANLAERRPSSQESVPQRMDPTPEGRHAAHAHDQRRLCDQGSFSPPPTPLRRGDGPAIR